MAKVKTTFYCQNCGAQHARWQGQCNTCKEWNTLVEEVVEKPTKKDWKQGVEDKFAFAKANSKTTAHLSN